MGAAKVTALLSLFVRPNIAEWVGVRKAYPTGDALPCSIERVAGEDQTVTRYEFRYE